MGAFGGGFQMDPSLTRYPFADRMAVDPGITSMGNTMAAQPGMGQRVGDLFTNPNTMTPMMMLAQGFADPGSWQANTAGTMAGIGRSILSQQQLQQLISSMSGRAGVPAPTGGAAPAAPAPAPAPQAQPSALNTPVGGAAGSLPNFLSGRRPPEQMVPWYQAR